MKKILAIFLVILMVLVIGAAPVLAAGKSAPASKSKIGHLYLYAKDPATWEIVPGGAWGKLKYNTSGPVFQYVFNGKKLMKNTEYSLVYYRDYVPEVWPHPVTIIAQGKSNAGGNIHLGGKVDLGKDLPEPGDVNAGAKIWLVPTYHITDGLIVPWLPTEILFEKTLITYDDTDAP